MIVSVYGLCWSLYSELAACARTVALPLGALPFCAFIAALQGTSSRDIVAFHGFAHCKCCQTFWTIWSGFMYMGVWSICDCKFSLLLPDDYNVTWT